LLKLKELKFIVKGTPTLLITGGNYNAKITEDHRDSMMELTKNEISLKLQDTYDVNACHQTISNHLDGILFSRTKIHYCPMGMNSVENKTKRREFVHKITVMREENNYIAYMDETN